MNTLVKKIGNDVASYLYDNLQAQKISEQEAAEIAQKALECFPENTPDIKLEKPLVKFCQSYPNLSSFFKQYLEEIHDKSLENLRREKIHN